MKAKCKACIATFVSRTAYHNPERETSIPLRLQKRWFSHPKKPKPSRNQVSSQGSNLMERFDNHAKHAECCPRQLSPSNHHRQNIWRKCIPGASTSAAIGLIEHHSSVRGGPSKTKAGDKESRKNIRRLQLHQEKVLLLVAVPKWTV